VVHGHDWLVGSAAARLAQETRAPFATTIHATEHGRHQGWVDKHPQAHIHGVEAWMTHRAARVIVCSQYMRDHVTDVFGVPEARVSVIPNGIDPDDLVAVADLDGLRARFATAAEKLVVLVGRLVYEKGFQLALDALGGPDGVVSRVHGVRFVVAGSGPHQAELEAQARRLGLSSRGTFLGWIGDEILHSLYRTADLCVVPSLYEPFGLVALEAMASGCPCVVADTGGLREVVPTPDVGVRFRTRDTRSLAATMERVLTDGALRERLVSEAFEHVRRFDWGDIALRTREAYAEVRGASVVPVARRASQRGSRLG
jgi:glycogen(starch) synthase